MNTLDNINPELASAVDRNIDGATTSGCQQACIRCGNTSGFTLIGGSCISCEYPPEAECHADAPFLAAAVELFEEAIDWHDSEANQMDAEDEASGECGECSGIAAGIHRESANWLRNKLKELKR